MLKPRLNYANVAATLALVFSMTGGAMAAKHYLITSTKQISPKVVKALKGKAGPSGPQGLPGKEGPAGKEGPKGENGSAIAYAHVLSTGSLDTADSKNVSSAVLISPGIFCLTVTVPVVNATTAVDTGNSGGTFGFASAVLKGQDAGKYIQSICPEPNNVLVGTAEHKGENQSMAFWISFS